MKKLVDWYLALTPFKRILLTIPAMLTALFGTLAFIVLFCFVMYHIMGLWCILGIPAVIIIVIVALVINHEIEKDKKRNAR